MNGEEELTPPSAIVANKYQIVRLIGRGGMGAVWEGRHTTLGTRVAVKFIDSEFADRPDVQKRFETEAKAAATIQSKHAIQIFDHGIGDDGRPYIVMEFLEGEPLDARLARFGTVPLPTITRMLQQVGRALTRAHERNIVHRDLKPENIFLVQTIEDDDEIAKVLDFGIAKLVGEQHNSLSGGTKTGAILGTPFYMSPEQARGLKEVDHRADIWSLGVIAYRAVVGKLPFDGQSVGDLLVNICTADPVLPSVRRPDLPPQFDAWVQRSLARKLEDRFGSVAEQMDTLAMIAGVSVRRGVSSASSPTPVIPARTMAMTPSQPPMPFTATPMPPGATPPPGAVTSIGLTTSLGQPTQSRGLWTILGVGAVLLLLGGGASALLLFARTSQQDITPSTAASAPPAPTSAVDATATTLVAPLPSIDAKPVEDKEPKDKPNEHAATASNHGGAGGGKAKGNKAAEKTAENGDAKSTKNPVVEPKPAEPAKPKDTLGF